MKTRVISAIIMLIIFLPVLVLGGIPYIVVGTILAIMGLYEILRLEKIPLLMKVISYLCSLFIIISDFIIKDFNSFNYYLIIGMFLLYSIIMIINSDLEKYDYKKCLWLLIVTLMIGFLFKNFISVRILENLSIKDTTNLYTVIYLFLITIMTDSFALFSGKLFGKHKLIPKVSPNKTVEGSIGGTIFGTLIPVIFLMIIGVKINLLIIIETFVLSIICAFGDLFFSSIKRCHNIKDFSNLIPGHGGILDRLDSILFVVSAYIIMVNIL